jgi:hypothetical protein
MKKRTWKITDLDGTNERRVTVDQLRAELEIAKAMAMEKFRADAAASDLKLHSRWS